MDAFVILPPPLLLVQSAKLPGFGGRAPKDRPQGTLLSIPSLNYPCLYKGGETGLLKLLLDAGADINAQEGRGYTPLMLALFSGKQPAVRRLVERGANRDLRNREGKSVYDLIQGDHDRQRWLRTKEEEAKQVATERLTITTALKSGHPFFGEAQSNRRYPFQITFDTFDESSGRCAGRKFFYSSDDRAVFSFEGLLQGSDLALWQTGILDRGRLMKEGQSVPDLQFTLRLGEDERLIGDYAERGSTRKRGEMWIDLNEARRTEMEVKVAQLLRFDKLREEARTATKEIAKALNRVSSSNATEVILTDVSIKGKWGGEEELHFLRISKFGKHESNGNWKVVIEGPRESGRGEYRREIDFRKNKDECDNFHRAVVDAYDAWKTKYAELFRGSGG